VVLESMAAVKVTLVFNDTEPLYEIPTALSVLFIVMYITIVLLGKATNLRLIEKLREAEQVE